MTHVKTSDIKMMEQDGSFQMAIGNSCVTGYEYKSADDCYKAYIAMLINSIEKVKSALMVNTGF